MSPDVPPGPDAGFVADADAAFAAEARRIADLAFDMVMSGIPQQLESMPPELEPADAVRWVGDRITELVAGFAELPLDRLVGAGGATAADPSTARPASPPPRGEPVTLTASTGGLGEVRIWIHPFGDLGTGTLRFRLGDLQSSGGDALPGDLAVFTPPEVTVHGAVTSTLLRYPVPIGTRPGRYDGVVLASGVTDAVLPVTLVVEWSRR